MTKPKNKFLFSLTTNDHEPEIGELSIVSEGGESISNIIKNNKCHYFMILLNNNLSKTKTRVNISKSAKENLWRITSCSVNEIPFSEWLVKNDSCKLISPEKIEDKVNHFISFYNLHAVFG